MRVILDTNVFVSGVFFSGPPARILEAWRDQRLRLVLSSEIFAEYQRPGALLADQYCVADLDPVLVLLATESEWIEAQVPSHSCSSVLDRTYFEIRFPTDEERS